MRFYSWLLKSLLFIIVFSTGIQAGDKYSVMTLPDQGLVRWLYYEDRGTDLLKLYLDSAKYYGFNTIAFYIRPDEIENSSDYLAVGGYLDTTETNYKDKSKSYRQLYKDYIKKILEHSGNFNLIIRIVLRPENMANADPNRMIPWDDSYNNYFMRHPACSSSPGGIDSVKTTWNNTIDFYHCGLRTRILNFENSIVRNLCKDLWSLIIDDVMEVAENTSKQSKILCFTLNSTPSNESEYWYGFYAGQTESVSNILNNNTNNNTERINAIDTWQNTLRDWLGELSLITKQKRDAISGRTFGFGCQLSGAFDDRAVLRGTFNLANIISKLNPGDWLNNADLPSDLFTSYNHCFSMDYYTSIGAWKGLNVSNELSAPSFFSFSPSVEVNAFIKQVAESYNHGAKACFVTNWMLEEISATSSYKSVLDTVVSRFHNVDSYTPQKKQIILIDPWSLYKTENKLGSVVLHNEEERGIRTMTDTSSYGLYNCTNSSLYTLLQSDYETLSDSGKECIQFITTDMIEKQSGLLNNDTIAPYRSIYIPSFNQVITDGAKTQLVLKSNLERLRLGNTNIGIYTKYQSPSSTLPGSLANYKSHDLLWVDKANLQIKIGRSNISGSSSTFRAEVIWREDWSELNTNTRDYYVGDFNGDGLDDIINFLNTSGRFQVAISNGTSGFGIPTDWNSDTCKANGADIRIGDFNGDGKDDILWVDKNNVSGDTYPGLWVRLSSTGNNSFGTINKWSDWGGLNTSLGFYVGDFNGDGKDDFLNLTNDHHLQVVTSVGSGFTTLYDWGIWQADAMDIRIGDFNGDGKDDLLWVDKTNKSNATYPGIWVKLSKGNSLDFATQWCDWGGLNTSKGFFTGDFNGDGLDDFLNYTSDNYLQVVTSVINHFSQLSNWGSWSVPTADYIRVGNFNKPTSAVLKEAKESSEYFAEIPKDFILFNNYPNPFNPSTAIKYSVPTISDVELIIYDILGNEIKSFNINSQSPGYQNIIWNGTNNNNQMVSSGVYIYKLVAKSLENGKVFSKSAKMLLLK